MPLAGEDRVSEAEDGASAVWPAADDEAGRRAEPGRGTVSVGKSTGSSMSPGGGSSM